MPSLLDLARSLLGVSVYAPPPSGQTLTLDDDVVVDARRQQGGNIQPLPQTSLRFYHADIETAIYMADRGDLSRAAALCRAMKQDGVYSGLLDQRTSGLVRLPKRFFGDDKLIAELGDPYETDDSTGVRSVFDMLLPPSEIAALAADGVSLGVGVAEQVPVVGRDFPTLVRLDPQYLEYSWSEGKWFYRSNSGRIEITPGDGRWVLHIPGARQSPWQFGTWMACGRAYVTKAHALLHRANYSAKLANPARVAKAPAGATEPQRAGFLRQVIAWGLNSVFELPPGWDVALLEGKGTGWEVFGKEIEDSNNEFMICLAGQIVTTTGGTGFVNHDLYKSIRSDLIQATGDALAYTINTQVLPQFYAARLGFEAAARSPIVAWDTKPPKDLNSEAQSLIATATAINTLQDALTVNGVAIDVRQLIERFGVPVVPGGKPLATVEAIEKAAELAKSAGFKPTASTVAAALVAMGIELEPLPAESANVPKLDLAPTDIAKVVRVDEARAGQGLSPIGDERGKLTISELEAQAQASAASEPLVEQPAA